MGEFFEGRGLGAFLSGRVGEEKGLGERSGIDEGGV
jgi:hypothetical protein